VDGLGLLGGLGEAKAAGQGGQLARDRRRLLGRHPPDQLVVARMAVGVLQGELGLADPAQPVQRLRLDLHDRGSLARVQAPVELVEQVDPAGEAGVAGWQVGHQWAAVPGWVEPVQQRRRRVLRGRAGGLLTGDLPGGQAGGGQQQGEDCPPAPAVVGPQPSRPLGGVGGGQGDRDAQHTSGQGAEDDRGGGGESSAHAWPA
jgi:hypothetical protein